MDALSLLESRGFVQQVSHRDEVAAALAAGPVTFYIGFDPTADSLHCGSLVQLMILGWLQRLGHRPIALVGGGTSRIGDPSGRTELRTLLSEEAIAANSAGLRRQIGRYLGGAPFELVDNADWLLELRYVPFLREIGRHFSVNRMLAAEAYKIRLERGLSFIEFNYQILQAYDFLQLHDRHGCRLQIGGDDQWGNILAGVDLVRRVRETVAWGLTTPLLTTASGAKMGKTASGAVWLDGAKVSPFDFWQYWYNCEDGDAVRFLRMFTFLPEEEIAPYTTLTGAAIREAKRRLANEVTTLAHGAEAAAAAEAGARAMTGAVAAESLPTVALAGPTRLPDALVAAELAKSKGDARRLVAGGGVTCDGARVEDPELLLAPGDAGLVVRVGKKRAVRFVAG